MTLTWPNLIGYAAVGWLLARAIGHLLEAHATSRTQRARMDNFERKTGSRLASLRRGRGWKVKPELRQLLREVRAPKRRAAAAWVVERILREPDAARDDLAVAGWVDEAIEAELGHLRSHMLRIRSAAPVVGVIGTVGGFLAAAWSYGQDPDTGRVMMSVALALVTTLVAGVVVLLEGWVLEGTFDALEFDMRVHASRTAARVRTFLKIARERAA